MTNGPLLLSVLSSPIFWVLWPFFRSICDLLLSQFFRFRSYLGHARFLFKKGKFLEWTSEYLVNRSCAYYAPSVCNINIPRAHNFFIFSGQIPSPWSERLFKCPTPGPFFYGITGQDRFKTNMLLVPYGLFTRAGRHRVLKCRRLVFICRRVEVSDWLAPLIITFARGDHVWAKYSGQMT